MNLTNEEAAKVLSRLEILLPDRTGVSQQVTSISIPLQDSENRSCPQGPEAAQCVVADKQPRVGGRMRARITLNGTPTGLTASELREIKSRLNALDQLVAELADSVNRLSTRRHPDGPRE